MNQWGDLWEIYHQKTEEPGIEIAVKTAQMKKLFGIQAEEMGMETQRSQNNDENIMVASEQKI